MPVRVDSLVQGTIFYQRGEIRPTCCRLYCTAYPFCHHAKRKIILINLPVIILLAIGLCFLGLWFVIVAYHLLCVALF